MQDENNKKYKAKAADGTNKKRTNGVPNNNNNLKNNKTKKTKDKNNANSTKTGNDDNKGKKQQLNNGDAQDKAKEKATKAALSTVLPPGVSNVAAKALNNPKVQEKLQKMKLIQEKQRINQAQE